MATTRGDGKELNVTSLARKNFSTTITIPKGSVVSVDTANEGGVVIPTAAGAVGTPLGITLEAIPPGATGAVRVYGTAIAIAGAAISSGVAVTASNTGGQLGRAVTAGAAAAQVGTSLMAAVQAGDEIEIILDRARNA